MKHPGNTPPPRRLVNRGSWIGLFAVLMMFIGPLLSQAMPMGHGRAMANMSMPMAMPMHSHGCEDSTATSKDPTGLHPIWERCGYCSLFFHCPALPHTLAFIGFAPLAGATPVFAAARRGHNGLALFPGALTRAPPSHVI